MSSWGFRYKYQMLLRLVLAALFAAASGLLWAVIQTGPDQSEKNFCDLIRRMGAHVSPECVPSFEVWGRPVVATIFFVCLAALLLDVFRWARRGRFPRLRHRFSRRRNIWMERDQLELGALAALSVGLPADAKCDVEPQLSRYRALNDAVREGELEAVDVAGDKPNVMTLVSREQLRTYAQRMNNRDLSRVLRRWDRLNPPKHKVKAAPTVDAPQLAEQIAATQSRLDECEKLIDNLDVAFDLIVTAKQNYWRTPPLPRDAVVEGYGSYQSIVERLIALATSVSPTLPPPKSFNRDEKVPGEDIIHQERKLDYRQLYYQHRRVREVAEHAKVALRSLLSTEEARNCGKEPPDFDIRHRRPARVEMIQGNAAILNPGLYVYVTLELTNRSPERISVEIMRCWVISENLTLCQHPIEHPLSKVNLIGPMFDAEMGGRAFGEAIQIEPRQRAIGYLTYYFNERETEDMFGGVARAAGLEIPEWVRRNEHHIIVREYMSDIVKVFRVKFGVVTAHSFRNDPSIE